jgi:hypothetical protein
MKIVRIPKAILAAGLLYAGSALGQTPTTNAQTATNAVTATIESEAERTWSFGFSAYGAGQPRIRAADAHDRSRLAASGRALEL